MTVYRIKRFSWNSWIDKKIENSKKRQAQMREYNKAYRETPQTPEEKRLNESLKKLSKNTNTIIVDSPSNGGGFTPDYRFLPKDKVEKFGVNNKSLKPNQKYIFVNDKTKPHILAHELGHSHEDSIYRWYRNKRKKDVENGKLQPSQIPLLIEETRANLRGYNMLKKQNPDKKTMKESKQGFKNCEKHYLEGAYQHYLEKLKTKE